MSAFEESPRYYGYSSALRARLDEIRDTTWTEPIKTQQQQLELLTELPSRRTEC